jgi:hypothetical protein
VTQPLYWIPTLFLPEQSQPFYDPLVKMFLSAHQGRGHIVSPQPLGIQIPSLALTQPQSGYVYHVNADRDQPPVKHRLEITDVVVSCPTGIEDASLARLDTIYRLSTIRRITLTRDTPRHPLFVLSQALDTVLQSFPQITIGIDVQSFGWDAAAHFAQKFPALQLDGIDDNQLWRLIQLGQVLGRPVWLDDFSRHPKPLPGLPQFKVSDPPPIDVHRIPFSSRFR